MDRDSYPKWQRPTYDFARSLVLSIVNEAVDKHGEEEAAEIYAHGTSSPTAIPSPPPVLDLPTQSEEIRDYSEELAQVRLKQAAWRIYSQVQLEVVHDMLTEVAQELQAARLRAHSAVDRMLLRAAVGCG